MHAVITFRLLQRDMVASKWTQFCERYRAAYGVDPETDLDQTIDLETVLNFPEGVRGDLIDIAMDLRNLRTRLAGQGLEVVADAPPALAPRWEAVGYVHPKCERVAVPARTYAHSDLNGDRPAYLFLPEAESMGLECWRQIEGVDLHTRDERMTLHGVANWTREVVGDFTIFVTAADARALGITPKPHMTSRCHIDPPAPPASARRPRMG